MTDEHGEVCGMRIGKGTEPLEEPPPTQCQCVHHESHITKTGTEPRPTRWEATY
jgi:hypothetical protein